MKSRKMMQQNLEKVTLLLLMLQMTQTKLNQNQKLLFQRIYKEEKGKQQKNQVERRKEKLKYLVSLINKKKNLMNHRMIILKHNLNLMNKIILQKMLLKIMMNLLIQKTHYPLELLLKQKMENRKLQKKTTNQLYPILKKQKDL